MAKMKALTYDNIGKWKVVEKDIPTIQDGSDAVVKLVRTTICGTDLHILKGDVPTCDKGRTLGHEGIGVITEAGSEVKNFKKGDRVVIRCITCCGACEQKASWSMSQILADILPLALRQVL